MAKKLFAFLGVGNKDGKYEEIEYYFTGKPEKGYITEYIQEALAELLNEPNLQIIVFVTEKAKDVNWEPKDKIGLKIKLEKLNVNYKAVDIPDGKQIEKYGKYLQRYMMKLNYMMKYMLM